MLTSLSSRHYQSGKSKPSFLLHSVGHWPNHSEIDASIIYADYYYIEALLRLKRLRKDKQYKDKYLYRSVAESNDTNIIYYKKCAKKVFNVRG